MQKIFYLILYRFLSEAKGHKIITHYIISKDFCVIFAMIFKG